MNLRKRLKRLWEILETGYKRQVTQELYMNGAIDLKEYLERMKETKR